MEPEYDDWPERFWLAASLSPFGVLHDALRWHRKKNGESSAGFISVSFVLASRKTGTPGNSPRRASFGNWLASVHFS
jgi:hypothetical protein